MIKFNDDFETKSTIAIEEERNKLEEDFLIGSEIDSLMIKIIDIFEGYTLGYYDGVGVVDLFESILSSEGLEYYYVEGVDSMDDITPSSSDNINEVTIVLSLDYPADEPDLYYYHRVVERLDPYFLVIRYVERSAK